MSADDLNDVERRLAACAPAAAGLDADAMLFAAGRASARLGPARFVWPVLSAGLAALACVLGVGLANERGERLALARQLRSSPPLALPALPVVPPASDDDRSTAGLLAVHRALEQGRDPWSDNDSTNVGPPGLPESPVLQARSLDNLLGP